MTLHAYHTALTALGNERWQQLRERHALQVSPQTALHAPAVLAISEFVLESCDRSPALLPELDASGALAEARTPAQYTALCEAALAADTEAAQMAALRQLRRRELVRIAWRDLAALAPLEQTLAELTAFADAAIRAAQAAASRQLAARFGVPRGGDGRALDLTVLGMGKLGGGELNFSSDIDLVFLYPESGDTDGARSISNEEYFLKLGQALIRLLHQPTVDGFVFRVDMRLRPFGDSGPLVASFGAFEDYLQQHGRDWERYAYVKARAITGATEYADVYANAVRPFVYRRYLDFGVFESLREMKQMIEREVARRELDDNVKLGRGGIREVEFVVQAMQLVRGGSDRALQTQSIFSALPRLAGAKLLPASAVTELDAGYRYLRLLENRVQMVADQQTHELPEDPHPRHRLALAMGHADWTACSTELDRHRARVAWHFQQVVFGPPASAAPEAALDMLWQDDPQADVLAAALSACGVEAPDCAAQLMTLRQSGYFRRLDAVGRRRLAQLLPRLLAGIRGDAAAAQVLQRLLRIVEAIGSRTSYLALLNENASALQRLVAICRTGDFLAQQVAQHPLLLDELIDERVMEVLPDRAQFAEELALRCDSAATDPERQIDAMRQFQRAAIFRIAALDLAGRLTLMQVSDRLTDVAELIVEQAMRYGWEQTVAVHGEPLCGDHESSLRPARVAAIGYGKLGGFELGYGSDLDVVFLHDAAGEIQQTAGPKVVDNAVFFLRYGQRVLHLLSVHTAAGRLYEVDTRLRPSGKGGMLVTSLKAFEEYQQRDAWTWEHQALLHSRAVAGDPELRAAFEQVRRRILTQHVRRESLADEVQKMRSRMRTELSRAKAGEFDIKQDSGGVADIEFLSQYWALRWADRYPPLIEFADTIRELQSVGSAALVDHFDIDVLTDAYRAYRAEIHHRSLEHLGPVVDAAPWAGWRERVEAIWRRAFADSAAADGKTDDAANPAAGGAAAV